MSLCTGYTATLVEKGQTFEEFVMTCARGMSFCVTMRDDSTDTPIPESFQASDWNLKELAKAKKDLAKLKKMSRTRREAYGAKLKAIRLSEEEDDWAKALVENSRVAGMMDAVSAWDPPKELWEFKEFMLQQLSLSIANCSHYEREFNNAQNASPLYFYNEAVEYCVWSVEYHRKQHAAELERVAERNRYLKLLRDSLKEHKEQSAKKP